ncbi:aminotransferase class V-fold PLP-dependent enzyme [Henriciella litoralis]|uniref:aminotransferase class V-fold PLP-dependent enzyme n=1 Tax=Henriciella litoralis TaxID=568102 RepID=UPI0009FCFA26|nr:cysteine desulfurase [Henriciella litoralis]
MSRPLDIEAIRAEFPILSRSVNGRPLAYLDNAASAQTPDAVLNAMTDQAHTAYANVHRGLHTLANETTAAFENAREIVRAFLNAPDASNIIFTKGGTEAINLVANGIAGDISPGDEIVLSVMEHHSNIVPWHFLRERYGAVLKWVEILEDGSLDMESLREQVSSKTRMVALTHMSNVLGSITDVTEATRIAHSVGAKILVDGCQAGVHLDIDVQEIGCDFYVLTGHKIYGPSGIGALFGTTDALQSLRPYQGGGEMIEIVERDRVTYNEAPHKFEAGTPPILQAIGFGRALEWLRSFDMEQVRAHENSLLSRAAEALSGVNGIKLYGTTPSKGPVMSFSVEGAHPHDIAQLLDRYGVAIRAGHHCAQPLMHHLGVSATARASFAVYNTPSEVDAFVDALHKAREMLL